MFKEYLDETPVSGALVPWHELPPALLVAPPPFLLGVLDEIDYGWLVLNQAAVILYANQLAQQELDDADFVTLRHSRLVTSSAANAAPAPSAPAASNAAASRPSALQCTSSKSLIRIG